MSIATAIQNAQTKVANAYTAVSNKGGTLPVTQNLTNLPTAINSIPSGGGSEILTFNISDATIIQDDLGITTYCRSIKVVNTQLMGALSGIILVSAWAITTRSGEDWIYDYVQVSGDYFGDMVTPAISESYYDEILGEYYITFMTMEEGWLTPNKPYTTLKFNSSDAT